VPSTYQRKVCGLCGNFNGFPFDDLRTRTGQVTNSAAVFGNPKAVGLLVFPNKLAPVFNEKFELVVGKPKAAGLFPNWFVAVPVMYNGHISEYIVNIL